MKSFTLYCDPEQGILTITECGATTPIDYSNYEPVENPKDLVQEVSNCIYDFLTE